MRLVEHNRDRSKLAGRIIKETDSEWVLKEFHPVTDPYWAESTFWSSTLFADIPYREGVEIDE